VLYLWTESPLIYYLVVCVQYVFFNVTFLMLLSRIGVLSIFSVFLVSTIPSVLLCFSALVFPERNVLFLLPMFLMAIMNWQDSRDVKWLLLAAAIAQWMIYLKESVLVFVAALSAVLLAYELIGVGNFRSRSSWRHATLYISQLLLCGIWATFYVLMGNVGVLATGEAYSGATVSVLNVPKALFDYLVGEPGTVVLLSVTLPIPFLSATRKNSLLVAMTLASWASFGLYLLLGLYASWYTAVSATVAALSEPPRVLRRLV
jgi:hypothetical protein